MKKITLLLFTVLAVCWYSNAQFSFPTITGPTNVAQGSPVTLLINNAGNVEGVPAGSYTSFTVTADWLNANNAYSIEADLRVTTSTGNVTIDPPTTGGLNNFNSTSLTFSGTLPGGPYNPNINGLLEIRLNQSFGGSSANWSNIVVTLTGFTPPLCTGSSSFIFTEEFNNTSAGWTGDFGTANGDWTLPRSGTTPSNAFGGNTGPSGAFSGANYMHYEASGGTTATASAVSPAIDLTSITEGAELSFYMHANGTSMGTLLVRISSDGGTNYTTVFTQAGPLQTSNTQPWQLVSINLGAYLQETIQIEFRHTGTGGFRGDMSIDFLRVEACDPPVLCPDPTNLVVSNITGTSADITWDAGGSETDWEIAIQPDGTGTPVGNGTPTSANNPYTDNTLTELTAYEVYVRADCDTDGFSNWVGPVDFTTPLANDDFADAIPISCGNSYNGDTTTATRDEIGAPDVTTVEPDTGADNDSPNVWYSFIGTGDLVTLSTCSNTNFDTEILVFTGTSGNLTLIDDAFDECDPTGLSNFEAETTFTSVFGTQYFISVEGWNFADVGAFQLSVICTPPVPVTYTYTDGWDANGNPDGVSTVNDNIIIASGEAVFSAANTNSQSITVNPTGAITVDVGATLFSLNGITLESVSNQYSSIISNGTINGPVIYERYVNVVGSGASGGNDLIGMPLLSPGQGFDDFLAIEDLSNVANSDKIATNGSVFAFGPYDNSGNGQYVNYAVSATDLLVPGKGYRAATAGETLTFAGTVETGSVQITITRPINGSQWNLVGNPYPSYMDPIAFLADNSAALDPNAVAIYGYHAGTDSGSGTYQNFTIVNNNSRNTTLITPGQGFLLATFTTPGTSETITFNPAIRTVLGSDDFILGRNANDNLNLKLKLSDGTNNFITDFYFNDNSSLGLDPGYDAVLFGNTVPNFAIYSHLVQDNEGRNMAIQSLGSTDLSDVNVPLGLKVSQGQQVTISIEESNLPDNVLVYLEDNLTNTFTLLNTGDYTFTASTNISGTGRFFLRYNEDTLSNTEQTLGTLQIFTTKAPSALVINGQLSGKTTLALYDIQGRLVLETTLNEGETSQRIDVSHLNAGIYVANLSNNTQQKTQKVIIR